MEGLKNIIQADLKEALKKRDESTLSVLRMLAAAILSKEKENRYKLAKGESNLSEKELEQKSQLGDQEIIEVVSSEVKKRRESITEFQKGKREDLAKKEMVEIEVLQKYLPEQISEEEIKKIVKEAINKVSAKEIKDMGKVMAELMPKVKGRADGSLVSRIVKEFLVS